MSSPSRRRLLCHPGLPYGRLLTPPGMGRLPAVLDAPAVHFYRRGSTALWHGVRLLRLDAGDEVLFPAYHCGIELDVLIQAGLKVRFYRVGRDLQVDPDAIDAAVRPSVKAVYLIHHFGFSGPVESVRRICDDRGLPLIEDCALALYANDRGRDLGTFGDLALFSARKTIAIPAGGALRINAPELEAPDRSPNQTVYEALKLGYLSMNRDLLTSRAWRLARSWFGRSDPDSESSDEPDPIEFVPELRSGGMSFVSHWVLARSPHARVAERRRRNFLVLLETARTLRRITPVVTDRDAGACPFVFPVFAEGDADEFIRFCRQRGVIASRMWPVPHPTLPADSFPEAAELKRRVVALPVHQDLEDDDLRDIGRILEEYDTAGG